MDKRVETVSRQELLSQDLVRKLFEHLPDEGVLVWRARPIDEFETARVWRNWNTRFAGVVAGHINSNGYRHIQIDGKKRLAHRLIWIYVNGPIPDSLQIDHINGDRADNRLSNLRVVTASENSRNTPKLRKAVEDLSVLNTSGYKGVSWNRHKRQWQVYIRVNGKNKFLGLFADAKTGGKVYAIAAIAYRGESANVGRKA